MKKTEWKRIRRYTPLYIMFLPVLAYYLIFCYAPMGGMIIAFKDYTFSDGLWGSNWAGLKHFSRFANNEAFWNIVSNTFRIALKRILIGFPLPIILALLLNELKNMKYKRLIQTAVYLPHFLSWVILYGFLFSFFSSTGLVNQIIKQMGGTAVSFLSSRRYYDSLFIGSAIWKETGWGAIIYLASLSNVDTGQIEAAKIDGASRFKQVWHVMLPAIRPTISIQLILSFGGILSVSFEQTMVMINDSTRSVAEVLDYYIYRMGILTANNYSYSTAVSMFRNVISLMMVLMVNRLAKFVEEDGGLW